MRVNEDTPDDGDTVTGARPLRNFAITGVSGYIAPRHLKAIIDTGHRIVAAVDPHDAAGVLDRFSFDTRFFTEFERFDRHLEKCRRGPAGGAIDYVAICSPNYLHDAHVRLALRVGADAICEKPLVINPWNLDALEELEHESGRRVYTVLQLRLHPLLIALKQELDASGRRHQVTLTYITARGGWYDVSWKGLPERSGGIATNIGIHFFDLLLWLFGPVVTSEVSISEPKRMRGRLDLRTADVEWFLSTDSADLGVTSQTGTPCDLPIDRRRRPRSRVQRGLRRPAHARLRRDAGRPRLRHRRREAIDRIGAPHPHRMRGARALTERHDRLMSTDTLTYFAHPSAIVDAGAEIGEGTKIYFRRGPSRQKR